MAAPGDSGGATPAPDRASVRPGDPCPVPRSRKSARPTSCSTPPRATSAGASAGGVKAIGAVEVLAAAGLVLPAVLGIAPVLVPLAAVGLVLLMAGAAVVRLRRREYGLVAVDALYILLAAFVAWGRFGPAPFLN
ncbi:DoxX family protein [Streptomyces novaecaesareae]|uniref:DoxX family protein n=1 Tax=Streptomyces novaecaesareae TaxID=68244 RepID=UPI000997C249|nr:DoxX family protein [Streptomyces novaecaesareae]